MAPRGYDRYMVVVGAGRNRKFVRFTDSERCAHFLGVLSLAAQSPKRGCLLIGPNEEAGAEEVASESSVPVRVARSTLAKLKRIGVLLWDGEVGAWRVHDWDYVNPPPGSSTERVRRYRANKRNGDETPAVTETLQGALPEVKGEEEESSSSTTQKTTRKRAGRKVDQAVPPEGFPDDLHPALGESLPILHRTWDARGGVEPQPRGVGLAMMRNPRADHVKVAQAVEHWLTSGRGQRARCADVTARFGEFVADADARDRGGSGEVVPLRDPSLERMDSWKRGYPSEAS